MFRTIHPCCVRPEHPARILARVHTLPAFHVVITLSDEFINRVIFGLCSEYHNVRVQRQHVEEESGFTLPGRTNQPDVLPVLPLEYTLDKNVPRDARRLCR